MSFDGTSHPERDLHLRRVARGRSRPRSGRRWPRRSSTPARSATSQAERAGRRRSAPTARRSSAAGSGRGCSRATRSATSPWRCSARTSPAPFLLAPIGVLSIAHAEGELAVARAAAALEHPLLPLHRRLVVDRGHRGGDGRRAALVPALLDQRPRDRRQPAPASRPERLLGGRRHARHADPRLAAPRPPPGLPPVHQGRGLRAVLQRPRLPGEAREAAGGGHAHGGRDDALDVPAPRPDVGRPRLAARADRLADARQGRADGGGRAAGRCRRSRRDHRLEPRRPAGGRRGRGARRARRRARRRRRRGDGADGRRHPPRRGRRQGDGARRGRGARRPAVRLRARGRRPGGRGGGAPAALGGHRHHDGARRTVVSARARQLRPRCRSRYSGSRSGS